MKKITGAKLGLVGLALAGQVNASDINNSSINSTLDTTKDAISNHIRIYGVGEKVSDKSYNGVGIEFENNNLRINAEKGSKITKASAIGKIDLVDGVYTKLGTGYLQRETLIDGVNKDVDQISFGGALGYGNDKNYNIEAGIISSKLKNAGRADSTSTTTYIEGILKEDTDFGGFDLAGTYKNTNVYGKNYSNYSADAGYYPTEDIRAGVVYDSIDHDSNDYSVNVGFNYKFDWGNISKGAFTPFVRASKNISKNVKATLEYRDDIQNKVLSMRDTFEESVSTSDFVARETAPDEFIKRTTKVSIPDANITTPDTNVTTPEVPTPTLTFNASNDGNPDDDLIGVSYDSSTNTYTFKVDTENKGSDDNIADVLVNITNGGYIEVNGVRYNNGEKFQVGEDGYKAATYEGTIKVYNKANKLVDTYNYKGTGN